jgi:ABC-type multidrug transport system fused ATPase/permease subunit
VQLISTFIGGFFVAFFKGWLLTLVLLSSIPLLVASGALMSIIISKTASRGQNAYGNAANVVEQTIGSIRTVCHVLNLALSKVCLALLLFSSKCMISTIWFLSRLHHLLGRSKL